MSLDARLQSVWYGPAWRSLPLWPLRVAVPCSSSRCVPWRIRVGLLRVEHAGVPVIVVGNLTVGGTGKTPVAAWLARAAARHAAGGSASCCAVTADRIAARPAIVTTADDPARNR